MNKQYKLRLLNGSPKLGFVNKV